VTTSLLDSENPWHVPCFAQGTPTRTRKIPDGTGDMINPHLRPSTHRRLADYLFKAKVIFILVLLTVLMLFHFFQLLGLRTTPVLLALFVETAVFCLYFPLRRGRPDWVPVYNVASLFLDVLAVTFVLHYFGGIYSMIWAADYIFFIALASVFLSRKGRLLYAVCAGTAYSLLCFFEHQGVLPRHNLFGVPASGTLDLFCWLSTMSLLITGGFIANGFMEMLSRIQRFADLGRLSTELAHEIRTPLQIIDGVTAAPGFPEKGRVEIKAQVDRIGRFVKEMLALGREEKRKLTRIRVQDIVDYSLSLSLQVAPPKTDVDLRRQFPEEDLWVMVDIDQVTKALSNLVRNGIESMPDKGRLFVTVCRCGFEWAQVEIRDTGVGIHRNEIGRIFEPFYTTKTGARGVGLGLAIARKYAEANGGRIEVESVAGRGSTFRMRLPLSHEARLNVRPWVCGSR